MQLTQITLGFALAGMGGMARLALRMKAMVYRLAGKIYGGGTATRENEKAPLVYIIRNDALGDCLISIPAIKALYTYFHSEAGGHCRVCLIMDAAWGTLFSHCPWADEIITIPPWNASFRERAAFYRTLAQRRPAKVITLPQGNLKADFLAYMCGCRESYVVDMLYPPRCQPSEAYLNSVDAHPWSHARKTHGVLLGIPFYLASRLSQRSKIRAVYVMSMLGHGFYRHRIAGRMLEPEVGGMAQLVEAVTGHSELMNRVDETDWLCDYTPFSLPEQFFVYGIGNSRSQKRLPPAAVGAIIQGLCEAFPEHTVVFTGTRDESLLVEDVLQCIPPARRPAILNLCGRCTVPQVAGILRRARFMISYDTGTGHLAGTLGVPVFVILGQAAYGAFFPNPYYRKQHCIVSEPRECASCNWVCSHLVEGRCACIADIHPETVVQTVVNAFQQEGETV